MSEPPRRRPSQQPRPEGSRQPRRPNEYEYDYEDEEYEEQPVRRRSGAPPPPPRRSGGPYYQQRPRYSGAPPQRDWFPYIMGGLLGAMVVGLGLVVLLLLNQNNGTTVIPGGPTESATPPRVAMDEFKKLYDNPSTRPMVIDVRAVEAYNEGHIEGALSMPEIEIDALVDKIPRNSLVIAYCQ